MPVSVWINLSVWWSNAPLKLWRFKYLQQIHIVFRKNTTDFFLKRDWKEKKLLIVALLAPSTVLKEIKKGTIPKKNVLVIFANNHGHKQLVQLFCSVLKASLHESKWRTKSTNQVYCCKSLGLDKHVHTCPIFQASTTQIGRRSNQTVKWIKPGIIYLLACLPLLLGLHVSVLALNSSI